MNWMILIIAILAAAAAYFFVSWQVAVIVLAVGLILALLFGSRGDDEDPPVETTTIGDTTIVSDTCGCAPGQVARVYKKNIIGKWKRSGNLPCAQALALTGRRPKKYQLRGCTT